MCKNKRQVELQLQFGKVLVRVKMWILAYFLIFVLPIFVLYRIKVYNAFWKHLLAIPGPKRYPLVGVLEDILNPGPVAVFASDRKRMKDFPEIYSYVLGDLCFVGIANPDDVEKILNNMRHIEKSQFYSLLDSWLGTGLLTSTGEKWQNRRKILTPAFHFSILQQFIDVFNAETEHLLRVLEKKCHEDYIDVIGPITEYTLCSLGETSMGINFSGDPKCVRYKASLHEYVDQITHRLMRPWLRDAIYWLTMSGVQNKRTVAKLHDFSKEVIRERQVALGSGGGSYSERKRLAMLDLLLKAKQGGADIDDEGIREEVDTFMFEGHDTTSMGICCVLLCLANEPAIQEEILREINDVLGDPHKRPDYADLKQMDFMERCVKESLRLYPSVPVIGRIAAENVTTKDGYVIPKGSSIHVYIFDLHRHPHHWSDPEKFDPDRFLPDNIAGRHPYAYVPFSAGPRNCIGQKYAILEIKSALCGILRKFRLVAVDKREDVKFKTDLVLRPVDKIRIKFVPRLADSI